MKKTIFNVFLFATGAAIGSVVTWKFAKTKYERDMQKEIDAFKKDYTKCMGNDDTDAWDDEDEWDDEDDEDVCSENDVSEYRNLAHMYRQSGSDTENDGEGAGDDEVPYINGPYVITPEDFGDGNYDHSLSCLTYYADGVLADDWYEQFDIDETIGEDSLNHFGDYTEDVVYVRNERLNADYEVTRDPRRFSDMVANDPLTRAYER